MTTTTDIAIVGGGAAGLVAAIVAARQGAAVTLFERQERVGRKILATGNGRCNLTNSRCSVSSFHGRDPSFAAPALKKLDVCATRQFFHDLGLCTVEEADGRIYPRSAQASSVLDVLRFAVQRLGVTVQTGVEVQAIVRKAQGFLVSLSQGRYRAGQVIVAGGGRAAPHLGGTPASLDLLVTAGHTLLSPYPALVPLKTALTCNRQLKGLKFDARVELLIDATIAGSESGEVLFTEYGLSGPPVIQLSIAAAEALQHGRQGALRLDCIPDMDSARVSSELTLRRERFADTPLEDALIGFVHKRLIGPVLRESGCHDLRMAAGGWTDRQIAAMTTLLKAWVLPLAGTLSWQDAHVMAGGIATGDFNARTLQSRMVPGLFAAGEVLDITGDCGGHNLQWAWSSGNLAGLQAAGLR